MFKTFCFPIYGDKARQGAVHQCLITI